MMALTQKSEKISKDPFQLLFADGLWKSIKFLLISLEISQLSQHQRSVSLPGASLVFEEHVYKFQLSDFRF